MSTRERWIVYPLLFLALGLALRDKLIPPERIRAFHLQVQDLRADRVECRQSTAGKVECNRIEAGQAAFQVLSAGGPNGLDGLRMYAAPQGGRLEILGRDGNRVLLAGADPDGRAGFLETYTAAEHLPLVQLQSSDAGGLVTLFGQQGRVAMLSGMIGNTAGLFVRVADRGQVIPLTFPVSIDARPTEAKP